VNGSWPQLAGDKVKAKDQGQNVVDATSTDGNSRDALMMEAAQWLQTKHVNDLSSFLYALLFVYNYANSVFIYINTLP